MKRSEEKRKARSEKKKNPGISVDTKIGGHMGSCGSQMAFNKVGGGKMSHEARHARMEAFESRRTGNNMPSSASSAIILALPSAWVEVGPRLSGSMISAVALIENVVGSFVPISAMVYHKLTAASTHHTYTTPVHSDLWLCQMSRYKSTLGARYFSLGARVDHCAPGLQQKYTVR